MARKAKATPDQVSKLEQELRALLISQKTQELKNATKRAEQKARKALYDEWYLAAHFTNENPNGPKTKIKHPKGTEHKPVELDADDRKVYCAYHHTYHLQKECVYAKPSTLQHPAFFCKDVAKALGLTEFIAVPKRSKAKK